MRLPTLAEEGVVREARELLAMLSASRASEYPEWVQVGWCLHNVSSVHLLEDWVLFSKQCPGKFVEGECERLWPAMRGGLGLGTLHLWARKDDTQAYKVFMGARIHVDLVACDGSHNSIATVAHKILVGTLNPKP